MATCCLSQGTGTRQGLRWSPGAASPAGRGGSGEADSRWNTRNQYERTAACCGKIPVATRMQLIC
jgi:hypothetical protein